VEKSKKILNETQIKSHVAHLDSMAIIENLFEQKQSKM
jgi:hypothetical protein